MTEMTLMATTIAGGKAEPLSVTPAIVREQNYTLTGTVVTPTLVRLNIVNYDPVQLLV